MYTRTRICTHVCTYTCEHAHVKTCTSDASYYMSCIMLTNVELLGNNHMAIKVHRPS